MIRKPFHSADLLNMRADGCVAESSVVTMAQRRRMGVGHVRALRLVALALLVCGMATAPAVAINIVIQLQNEGENPGYDASGARLKAIFEAAAKIWEDYLPNAGTYEVDVSWSVSEFEDEPTTLARWNFQFGGDNNIRVHPTKNWFIDPTPLDNSEYDFSSRLTSNGNFTAGQWLYRDLSSSQKSAWFDGSPPSLLEVGYRGRAIETATNPNLLSQLDLLSTVIHELGHELGVNSSGGPWAANPVFLPSGSATMAEDPDGGHLSARTSLMCEGCGLNGTRRLPSAIDIMAVADDEDFSSIDLPRQDYVGTGNWNSTSRWFGHSVPDSGDHAFLRSGGNVTMTTNGHVDRLFLGANSTLNVQNRVLTVDKDTVVEAFLFDGPNTQITVPSGGTFNTGSLSLPGGKLTLSGGTANVNGTFDIGAFPAELRGQGTVVMKGPLRNNGTIRPQNGTLTLSAFLFDGGFIDLDGSSGNGSVDASDGNLVVTGSSPLSEAFDGTMTIGAGHSVDMQASSWTLGTGGTIVMKGVGFSGSAIRGQEMIARGSIEVQALAAIESPVSFQSTAKVQVPTGTALILNGATTFNGGTYNGSGQIIQQSNVQVTANTTIDVSTYDMDGGLSSTPSSLTINANRTLRLDVGSIEPSANGQFDGSVNIMGGTLDVATHNFLGVNGFFIRRSKAWRMGGTLNLSPGAGVASVVGSPMIVGDISGTRLAVATINAGTGDSVIASAVTFEPNANVNVAGLGVLSLAGTTTFEGGKFTGGGVLQQTGNARVTANTLIETGTYDMDGAAENATLTVNPSVNLVIDSRRVEQAGANGFNGTIVVNGGTIDVRPHDNLSVNGNTARLNRSWRMEGDMQLNYDGAAARVAGNRMIVGQPDLSRAPARMSVDSAEALLTASVEFEANSVLSLALGGTAIGQFGRLRSTQPLTLAGDLEITLDAGYTPAIGSTYQILSTTSTLAGLFNGIVASSGMWDLTYGSNSVTLGYQGTAIPGDLNGDGSVDALDAGILFGNWGGSGVGDLNSDGIVDAADAGIQFGNWTGDAAPTQAVPEPIACGIGLMGMFGLTLSRRRHVGRRPRA